MAGGSYTIWLPPSSGLISSPFSSNLILLQAVGLVSSDKLSLTSKPCYVSFLCFRCSSLDLRGDGSFLSFKSQFSCHVLSKLFPKRSISNSPHCLTLTLSCSPMHYHHQKLFYLLSFLVLVSPIRACDWEPGPCLAYRFWNSVWNKVGIYTLGGQMRTQTELPHKVIHEFLSTAVGESKSQPSRML